MTGVRTVDVDSLEDRLFLAGHGTACAFSGSGRTVALDRETSTEILTLSGRRRLWRAPALLPGAEVLTHTGWHRLDRSGSERPLEGDAAPWRKALSSSSEYIEISRDRRALCSATSSGAVELWDLENGERLFESAGGARVGLAALPRGCVALSGTEVQLYLETGSPRSIASDGVALAQDGDVVLVATKDRILEVDRTGAVRTVAPSEPSVTAVGRFEGGVVLGLADGRILSGAGRAPFDGPTRRSVTVLSAGPRGTIIAGYLDGTIVILDPRTDRMLLAARLDGSINHILLEDSVLYATTVVGDHAAMDLGALRADYCTLMKALWASSPNLWEQGRAQPRPRPVDHACAR